MPSSSLCFQTTLRLLALFCGATLFAVAPISITLADEYYSGIVWPTPPVVDPESDEGPPSDATVLFDGTNLDAWNGGDRWEIADGIATSRGGGIRTKESFGDCQLHVEFASPSEVRGRGQGRGNSGIYMMGRYEIQILDSYQNETYSDGQAGAVYKQQPPMVNASRGPGEWQSFDIIFTAPHFAEDGSVETPAYVTVLHNGLIIQNHFELQGGTFWEEPPHYEAHGERAPIRIQYHGNPVRFRNIWIRELNPIVGTPPEEAPPSEPPLAPAE